MARHFSRTPFPKGASPVPPPKIAQASTSALTTGRLGVPPPPTRYGATVQRQTASSGAARFVPPPPPTPARAPLPARRPAPGAFGAPVLQRADSGSERLLEIKDDSVSYGTPIRGKKTYTYRKDGAPTAPTKPRYKEGMPPELPKGADSAAYQIVKIKTGDGPSMRGSYAAYSSSGGQLAKTELFLNGDYRTYATTSGFWCCLRTNRTTVAMVDYMQAEPPQQGIGAIMAYILADVLYRDGITIIASGTDTPAAMGLILAMGGTRTTAPGGFDPSEENGTVNFFSANPGSVRASAGLKIASSGWTAI